MAKSFMLTEDVIKYITESNPDEHPVLKKCREETLSLYPQNAWFQISPEQGAFMGFLAGILAAKNYLEVGVFTGYSALAVALAMRNANRDNFRVYALDNSAEWLSRAKAYWAEAGLSENFEINLGDAVSSLFDLHLDGELDLAFIDADKENTANYVESIVPMLRAGGVLIIDNVLWEGKVLDKQFSDADTLAMREIPKIVNNDPRLDTCFISVGDGLLLCRKK